MKKILVTTDFSAEAKAAYPVAVSLARALDAELTLLFVAQDLPVLASGYAMETPVWYVDPELQNRITEAQKTDLLNEQKLFADYPVKTHFISCQDIPSSEIVKYASDLKADFIVMSSHGRTGFARIIMGSITERVLREAPCPVVVVPTKSVMKIKSQ